MELVPPVGEAVSGRVACGFGLNDKKISCTGTGMLLDRVAHELDAVDAALAPFERPAPRAQRLYCRHSDRARAKARQLGRALDHGE